MPDSIPISLRVDNTKGRLRVFNKLNGEELLTISFDELLDFLTEQGYVWECDALISIGVDNTVKELYVYSMIEHNLMFSVSYEELNEYLEEKGLIWSEQYGF